RSVRPNMAARNLSIFNPPAVGMRQEPWANPPTGPTSMRVRELIARLNELDPDFRRSSRTMKGRTTPRRATEGDTGAVINRAIQLSSERDADHRPGVRLLGAR